MRATVAAILLLVPAVAAAQSASDTNAPRPATSLPAIGLPLPAIGLPLPPIGLAPSGPTATQSPSAPPRSAHRGAEGRRPHPASPQAIYAIPAGIYGWSITTGASAPGAIAPAVPPAAAAPAPSPRAATGTLRLELQPRPTGQLFVDTAYVGTLDELGSEFTMAEGQHHLEIREAGFKPFTLTVRIDEGRALVYSGDLERAGPPAAPVVVPTATPPVASPPAAATSVARKPFYYIPGCYLGDVPPKDAGLPATCDPRLTVTYRP